MTAKEYLKRIRKLDHDIDRKQYEFETLKKRRTYISGMDYSADRVQMSSDGEGFTSISDRLIDLQREINTEIDEYHDMRHKAINQIQSLSREEYSDILSRLPKHLYPLYLVQSIDCGSIRLLIISLLSP